MKIKINNPLCYQEVGRKDNQEDTLYPEPGMATDQNRIFMLCDGMGGHDHGEVASQCVAETVGKVADACNAQTMADMRQALEKGLATAYQKLDELDTDLESTRKMGTTLTFLGFCEDGALVGHIGDSRVYQMRPGKGIIFQTRDHSLVNDLLAAKEITPEEARNFKQKNVITRAVLPHREYPSKATCKEITDIQTGDIFFLCCDGVIEKIENSELEQILLGEGSAEARLNKLKQTCMERNTKDNNSCYLIEVKESDQVVVPVVEVTEAEDDDRTMTVVPAAKKKSKWLLWVLLLAIAAGIAVFVMLHITDNSTTKIGGNDIPPATTDSITGKKDSVTIVAPVVKEKLQQPVEADKATQEEQAPATEQKEPAKQNSLLKFKEKEETPTSSSEPQKEGSKTEQSDLHEV